MEARTEKLARLRDAEFRSQRPALHFLMMRCVVGACVAGRDDAAQIVTNGCEGAGCCVDVRRWQSVSSEHAGAQLQSRKGGGE
eukprot:4649080-Pleurochrysis_carterae.AAC.4